MIAIPAVNLAERSLTRVPRGVYASARADRPARTARAFADLGFTRLHLADGLTGSLNETEPAIEEIVRETDARIQVAGPSSGSAIESMFRTGAEYIVVGSRSIEEPEWLADIADLYPESIVVATDIHDRRVVRRGWVQTLHVDILDLVEDLNCLPLGGILASGLQLDGPTRNSDLGLVEDLTECSRVPLMVATKICTMNDLHVLEHRGAAAIVLGTDQLRAGVLDARAVAREFGA
jgi:phosphoribosylformimino-5-aminoimidazole carboxamide ribotide isomerase